MPSKYDDDESKRPILEPDTDTDEPGVSGASRVTLKSDDNEFQEELSGWEATACCNPSTRLHRFQALMLMCLLGIGKYNSINLLSIYKMHHKQIVTKFI